MAIQIQSFWLGIRIHEFLDDFVDNFGMECGSKSINKSAVLARWQHCSRERFKISGRY